MEHTEGGGGGTADPKVMAAFDEWWAIYPKPRDKTRSARLFCDAVAAGVEPGWIIASAKRYSAENARKGTARQFVASGDMWLENRRWEDHAPPALPAEPASTDDPMDGAAHLWGKTIRDGGYVPPSAISARLARVILAKGYATAEQLRAKGIRP